MVSTRGPGQVPALGVLQWWIFYFVAGSVSYWDTINYFYEVGICSYLLVILLFLIYVLPCEEN